MKLNQFGVLSPEPKRFSMYSSQSDYLALARSQSCDSELIESEIGEILGFSNFSLLERNSFPESARFSLDLPARTSLNPIVSDEKFIELEGFLSTSEDSGSDSDRPVQNN